jgi:aldehyde:ferredoxin oxidoreductase
VNWKLLHCCVSIFNGGNCGICDLDAIAMLDFLDDNYGVDTIEMGVTIGVAMEAGLANFGDAQAAINLVHEVSKGNISAVSSGTALPSQERRLGS